MPFAAGGRRLAEAVAQIAVEQDIGAVGQRIEAVERHIGVVEQHIGVVEQHIEAVEQHTVVAVERMDHEQVEGRWDGIVARRVEEGSQVGLLEKSPRDRLVVELLWSGEGRCKGRRSLYTLLFHLHDCGFLLDNE
jgi:hypothetical protein